MNRTVRAFGAAALGLAALGGGLFAYGSLVERRRWTVREETVPVLPPGARELTVLHLSDLHLAPWQRDKVEFVRSLAVFEPDLVIDTGDNLGHPDSLPALERALRPFAGAVGVFVHGSNDFFAPVFKNPFGYFLGPSRKPARAKDLDTPALNRLLGDDFGWLDLNNHARAVEVRGTRIEFFGTADAHRKWDRLDLLPGEVARMREATGWSGADVLRIGVTHAPYRRVLDAFVDEGAELIAAGHTHGGQVRIPGRPALVTNCDLPAWQASGLTVWSKDRKSAFLEVSAGLGTAITAPVRFACPPEAIVLRLVPRG